jgi:hypothetical protein
MPNSFKIEYGLLSHNSCVVCKMFLKLWDITLYRLITLMISKSSKEIPYLWKYQIILYVKDFKNVKVFLDIKIDIIFQCQLLIKKLTKFKMVA